MTELSQKKLWELSSLLQNQEITPCDIMADYIARINHLNPSLNAFAHLDLDTAQEQAKEATRRWKTDQNLSPYDGIGFTAKDLISAKNMPYRQGSQLCDASLCDTDAPAVARLKEAGMILLGKTTTCEFGHKGVTDSPLHGTSKNPHHINKTCGGSSGGAAIAAACGFGHLHIGNDGGGSIRIPASFCGLYGFKPSPDIVPVYPSGWMSEMRLSTTGLISHNMQDLIIGMDIIAAADNRHTSPYKNQNFQSIINNALDIQKIKIGFANSIPNIDPKQYFDGNIIKTITDKARLIFQDHALFDQNDFYPNVTDIFNIYWQQIAHFVASETPISEQEKMDPHFLFWANKGKSQSANDITRAHHDRIKIKEDINAFFQEYDFLACPTMAIAPLNINENAPKDINGKDWHDWSPFTYLANLAELPAITLPIGKDQNNLPIGLQIIAANGQDKKLLQYAYHLTKKWPDIKVITDI